MAENHTRLLEQRSRAEAVACHDQRHVLRVILAQLDAGDIAGACGELHAQMERNGHMVESFCEDPVINELLSYYAQLAKEENIRFFVRAFLPDTPPDRRTGLMVALCNVLENAVHACGQIPPPDQRVIEVIFRRKGRQVLLDVKSTYAVEISVDPQTGIPRSQRPGHSYGLQSLAAYLGRRPDWSAEDEVFTISPLL